MSTLHYLPHPDTVPRMSTEELRRSFLITDLFQPGSITLRLLDLDRAVVGGAIPGRSALKLEAPPEIAADFFTERRELGVLNIGAAGRISVDGRDFVLNRRDALYIGRGSRDVELQSADAQDPACFYLVSYPAHLELPSTLVTADRLDADSIGAAETANRRHIRKYFHLDGVRTAQLVMGVTELEPGSVWNTMPPHTHPRRTELYLYFDLPEDGAVFHLFGPPQEIRTMVVRNKELVLSPGWSIHAGCGTSAYRFCWAMGGENQAYRDMQGVPVRELR